MEAQVHSDGEHERTRIRELDQLVDAVGGHRQRLLHPRVAAALEHHASIREVVGRGRRDHGGSSTLQGFLGWRRALDSHRRLLHERIERDHAAAEIEQVRRVAAADRALPENGDAHLSEVAGVNSHPRHALRQTADGRIKRVELLVLDHFFDQDIDSLRRALGDDGRIRTISYEALRDEALAVFPTEVTQGLEPFAQPGWHALRAAYAERLAGLLADEYARRPFDAFVSPSDTFYYVRAAPEACQRLGVPFFVAQKEPTTSEHTMRVPSQRLREFAPPIATRMTVCSERHREFWLRAGADPERVVFTGQPRFDFYATAADERP